MCGYLSYQNDPNPKVQVVQGTGSIQGYCLHLKPGDTDWHHPLKIALEGSDQHSHEDRARRNADRAKRRRIAHTLSGPGEKSPFSPTLSFKIVLVPSIPVERQGKRGHIETCMFMHMPPLDFVLESVLG